MILQNNLFFSYFELVFFSSKCKLDFLLQFIRAFWNSAIQKRPITWEIKLVVEGGTKYLKHNFTSL